jgi:uncharacterized protein YndB with AHSA1/START domain
VSRVNTSIVINRPIEEVFDHWADGRLANEWNVLVTKKDVRMLTPEPIGPGSRFGGTYKLAGRVEYEILEYARPTRLRMRSTSPMGPLYQTITCEPVSGGTLLRQAASADFKGLFKLMRPLFERMSLRSFRDNDRALKAYLEGRAARSGAPVQQAAKG